MFFQRVDPLNTGECDSLSYSKRNLQIEGSILFVSVSDYFLVEANKKKKPFHLRKLRLGAEREQKNWLLKEDFSFDFKHGRENEIFYSKKSIIIWFATLVQLLIFRESIWSLYRIILMFSFSFLILLDIFISYCGLFSIQCLLFVFKCVSGKRFVVFSFSTAVNKETEL